jgi:hypothetical protein
LSQIVGSNNGVVHVGGPLERPIQIDGDNNGAVLLQAGSDKRLVQVSGSTERGHILVVPMVKIISRGSGGEIVSQQNFKARYMCFLAFFV